MRENFPATRPVLLEPVMKIEIECPTDFQGSVVGNLTSRRGMVVATEVSGAICRIEGEVPLVGDLRLLDRPAQHDPGPGHVHHGICQVSPPARVDRARGHRRPQAAGSRGVGVANDDSMRGVSAIPCCQGF